MPVVERLLQEQRVMINAKDVQNSTALHIAATYNDDDNAPDVVKMLLDAGADIVLKDGEGQTALHRAAQEGNFRCTEYLLQSVEKEKLTTLLTKQDDDGSTALMLAVGSGKSKVVRLLLDQDKNWNIVNIHNSQEEYPIHCAARSGDWETVEILIEVPLVLVILTLETFKCVAWG